MSATMPCPVCRGKGHVVSDIGAVFSAVVPIFGWLLGWYELDKADGCTRQQCERCGGRGSILVVKTAFREM